MSLYADYLREVTTDSIIEDGDSFVTYRYINDGKTVYVIDIFVSSACKTPFKMSKLVDIIVEEAKEKGCKELMGAIFPSNPHASTVMRKHLAYGMRIHSASENIIVLKKAI